MSVACDSRAPAPAAPPPGPVGTVESPLDPPTLFSDVAFVATVPCSASDYSTVDNCYNVQNPQRPSIFRELSAAWRPYRASYWDPLSLQPAALSGVMQPFPPNAYDNGWSNPQTPAYNDAANAIQVLPFNRGTNDGRLFVRGGCRGCAEGSRLYTFRPETLGHDFRYAFASKGTRFVQPSNTVGLHPFVYFNPMSTAMTAKNNGDFPDALHSTTCEDSMSALEKGLHGRNPVACRARYDVGSQLVSGDCYELSLVYGMAESTGRRWELRSVDLTVFVRAPKSLTAGDPVGGGTAGWGLWVYPRNPEGEVKSLPTWDLPPFRPFNPHDSPWSDMNSGSAYSIPGTPDTIDWRRLFTANPGFQCYTAVPVWPLPTPVYVRNTSASAPKWCQFFDRQSYRSSFQVEDDEDAVIGNGGTWNGAVGWGAGEKPYALFEPATSGDGRMLIVNMNGLYYATSNDVCRASSWGHFKPISMLPMDSTANARYELAKSQVVNGQPRPFRDTMGNAIPFGTRNQGAYPWLDREGKNLFFAAKNNPHDGYYARQVVGVDKFSNASFGTQVSGTPANDTARATFNPDRAPAQSVTVLGAWTHGKAVILDNGLSISDLGGNNEDQFRRTYDLRLYAGADVRLTPHGASQLFSFENQLNHFDGLRPTLPFDVVWNVQADTQRNTEVAFDDYLNKRAFVVAHMNAAMRMDVSPHGPWRAETFPQDGFVPMRDAWAYVRGGGVADFRFKRNPLAQNAATGHPLFGTDGPQPPSSLRLRGGARIEPVALGGVSGKGVWLDGINDFMDMGYPVDASKRDWLFGIWLDSRQDNTLKPGMTLSRSLPRTIFYFSDNSSVGLVQVKDASSNVWHELSVYNGATGATYTVNLGSLVQTGRYFHFGMKVYTEAGRRTLAFYIDGTWHSTLTVAPSDVGFNPMWNSVNGWTWMTVGDPGPAFVPGQSRLPFYGWVDELRIYALSPDDVRRSWTEELLCNQALGTTVDLSVLGGEAWHPALDTLRWRSYQYPGSRRAICEQLRLGSYVEPLDYPAQYGEHLCIDRVHKNPHASPSLANRCLRSGMLAMPTLQAVQPRPDTSNNAFCLSCHTGTAPLPGLRLGALTAGTGPRFQDRRRQPMNVPAVLGGVVPPWLTTGLDQPDGTRTLDHYFDHFPAP